MHEITTTPKFEHVFGEEWALVKCENPTIGDFSITPQIWEEGELKPQTRAL